MSRVVGPWDASWPTERLGELLSELAARGRLSHAKVENPPPGLDADDPGQAGLWIQTAAEWLDVEAEPVQVGYGEVGRFLAGGGPAVVRIGVDGEFRFLALVASAGEKTKLLTPESELVSVPRSTVREWICARFEDPLDAEVRAFLRRAGVSENDEEKARQALLHQRLEARRVGSLWMLRPPPGASFLHQLRRAAVPSRLAVLVIAHTLQYALFILAWWIVGRTALQGRVDTGWMTAWMLLLLTLVPLRAWTTWLQGAIAIRAGGVLKRRLLAGAMRLEPEEIRHQGAGELLGKVLESEALESLALGGGFLLLLGGIELLVSALVLAQGAAGLLHVVLLAGWAAATAALGWRYFRRRARWTGSRLELTHLLVESMLGHRTRLAQEARDERHEHEDRRLDGYLGASRDLDRMTIVLAAVVPRGWLVLGVASLGPAVVAGEATMARIAVAVGGVILSYRALGSIAGGMAQLFGAVVAWQTVRDLFAAAARPEMRSSPSLILEESRSARTLLEAREIHYAYPGRPEPALRNCEIEVKAGDRVLVQGPSGSGKSTLAAVLAGLRRPSSGLLLLGGLDQQSTGLKLWRRAVVLAPQFHENHVLSESLAFNVLMGRRWPAHQDELDEAEAVCRSLGLGDLLDRMPGGMFQMVGETGWQLSHGERNRVFLARVLLQNEGLTVLDESFEPLDSENAMRASRLFLERVPSIVAITHS